MKTLARILLVIFTLTGLLWTGLITIEEITNNNFDLTAFFQQNQVNNFFELIDKSPLSTFAILSSVALYFLGKRDKNNDSYISIIFISGFLIFLFFTTFVKGDNSFKFCTVTGIIFLCYYLMYSLGRRFQTAK